MEKLKTFYRKYLKNYLVLLIVVAIGMDIAIETLARHSLIESLKFIFMNPIVSLCNILLILAVISLSLLFKRRIFAMVIFGMTWMAVGIVNGVILANRMTPFTVKDFSNLEDGLGIITNYFSTFTLILAIVGIAALVFGAILLFRKAPKYKKKIDYKKVIITIAVIGFGTFGAIQLSVRAGVLDTFFANLAYAYRDNGVPYCFLVTWVDTGVDRPADYSKEKVENIFSGGELGKDNIYTPVEDDDTDVENKPNVIFLQLESFIDPTRVDGIEYSRDPMPNFRKLMEDYSSGFLTVPAVGAGTANVEFEVMTGLSVKFFGPGEYPYKSVLKEQRLMISKPWDTVLTPYTTTGGHFTAGTRSSQIWDLIHSHPLST